MMLYRIILFSAILSVCIINASSLHNDMNSTMSVFVINMTAVCLTSTVVLKNSGALIYE